MNTSKNPWDLAYEEYKDIYTKEEIDEMPLCEVAELLDQN
jgi:hypothetical protein